MTKAPALFIGHGSPMNAIEDTPSSRGWAAVAQRFPKPRAIVAVSAHWVTDGVRVTTNARPRTIHDFGRGFPQALFDVQYPAPGDPGLSRDIINRVAAFGARGNEEWGLDHGTWSILVHMYPDADIPVVQVSLDARAAPARHYEIGRALSDFRDDNVLVMASGNIVHNLRSFFSNDARAAETDKVFDAFITDAALARDHAKIEAYAAHPNAAVSAPDWDHFTPVLYGVAAGGDDKGEAFNRDFAPGISMTSLAYGLPQ
jgi:4,5-DOPA dioxygenase extradiol